MSNEIIVKSDTEYQVPCHKADLDQWAAWVDQLTHRVYVKIDRTKGKEKE